MWGGALSLATQCSNVRRQSHIIYPVFTPYLTHCSITIYSIPDRHVINSQPCTYIPHMHIESEPNPDPGPTELKSHTKSTGPGMLCSVALYSTPYFFFTSASVLCCVCGADVRRSVSFSQGSYPSDTYVRALRIHQCTLEQFTAISAR